MKFRGDFVTNSSSSSFIVGKPGEDKLTIDDVFRTIRNIYRDYIAKVCLLKDHAEEYGLVYDTEAGRFLPINDDDWEIDGSFMLDAETASDVPLAAEDRSALLEARREKIWVMRRDLDRKLQDAFGIDTWEILRDFDTVAWKADQVYPWLALETYAEYQSYWLDKIRNEGATAPFAIYDYANPQADYVHLEDGKYGLTEDVDHDAMNFEVFGWYVPCCDNRFDGRFDDQEYEYCNHCYFASAHDDNCRNLRNAIKDGTITVSNCVQMILGRFCINSESGLITQYVVDRLIQMCEYSCNHME